MILANGMREGEEGGRVQSFIEGFINMSIIGREKYIEEQCGQSGEGLILREECIIENLWCDQNSKLRSEGLEGEDLSILKKKIHCRNSYIRRWTDTIRIK